MKKWNRNAGFLILFILCMAPFIVRAGNNTSRLILGQPWYDERPATKAVISPGSYLYGNPSAAEQAHLELINRARLDPQAEANRLLSGNINEGPPSPTISTTAKQPLTFNKKLYDAAKYHSQDMINNNFFDHYGSDGRSPFQRMNDYGYSYTTAGENIAANFSTAPLNEVNTILAMHDNFVIDSGVSGRGHRVNIFNDNFKEVGIGAASGGPMLGWPYAWTLTCDFGAQSGNSFVLGVVYDDATGNGYTAGEGIGNVLISVVRSNGDTASTSTASAGGYGIPLPNDSYTVTARLSDGRELVQSFTITGKNIKIDFKEADFPSTPPPPDSTPNPFTFTDQTNMALSTVITSNTITVSGINEPADISITTGGEYKINDGSYTSSSGTVNNGNTVTVRQTSSGSNSTTTNATLTIGGVSDTFSVTTMGGPDTTPNEFTFTDQTNVALSTVITSNEITVSGITSAAAISITGGEYKINTGSYTSTSGTVNNGNTVTVRLTSSGSNSTTTNAMLTIGGVSDTFSVTTLPPAGSDTTPNQFTFTDRTNVTLSMVLTSNIITVSGIDAATPISITGGTYSINSGSYTSSSGTVYNGNTITVQLTSSGSYSTMINATLTIGGVSDTFSVTTQAETPSQDTTPAQFTFTDQTNVQLSTVITSNTITISGINTAAPISITGGTYSINGGSYTSSSGTVNNGNTITVQLNSSGNYSTKTDATINIGGVSDTFSGITKANPTVTPPDQFTFTDQTDAALSAVITSNTITVSGITSTTPISITGGTYSINGGSYTSADGTVNPEDTVTVQQTSSESHSTTTNATLIIGGISDTFSVTTISSSSGGGGEGEGGGGGGCFIATAAFGSPMAGQVEILRQFRDRYLLINAPGQKFVSWYYRNGPVAASWIKDKPLAKATVRMALYPLIGFSLLLISGYLPFVTIGLLLSALLFLRFRPKELRA